MISFSKFVLCLSLLIWKRVRKKCCITQTQYIFYSHLNFTIMYEEIKLKPWRKFITKCKFEKAYSIIFTGRNHSILRETRTSDHQTKPLILNIFVTKCSKTQTSEVGIAKSMWSICLVWNANFSKSISNSLYDIC